MRGLRTLLTGLTSATMVTALLMVPAQADSLSSERALMSQLQSESNATWQQLSQDKAKAAKLTSSIEKTNNSLANVRQAIAQNKKQTAEVLAKIKKLTLELQRNQKQLETDKEALVGQIRSIYEDGKVPYINVLLQSTSFDDLLSRLYMLEQVSKAQKKLVQQVTDLQHSIQKKQTQQKSQYSDLAKKEAQLKTYQAAEQILVEQQRHALAEVKTNISEQSRKRNLLESQIQVTQAQIQQIELETQQAEQLMQNQQYVKATYNSLPHVDAQTLIQYGEKFMGTPYVWGGTSPDPGFDCSGFVQYVFAHFGVSLYRTSEEQFAEGVPVSTNNLQPGDLVFFSTYAPGATHVGIYIGNGMMLDSEDMGLVIDNIFNSYWGPKYLGARQVIK